VAVTDIGLISDEKIATKRIVSILK